MFFLSFCNFHQFFYSIRLLIILKVLPVFQRYFSFWNIFWGYFESLVCIFIQISSNLISYSYHQSKRPLADHNQSKLLCIILTFSLRWFSKWLIICAHHVFSIHIITVIIIGFLLSFSKIYFKKNWWVFGRFLDFWF